MIPAPQHPDWLSRFPGLEALQEPAWTDALSQVQEARLPAGATVFRAGDPCRNYLFVLDGSVRVASLSHEGREIVLYHVGPGQTCILTTSCLMGETGYPATGVAEQPIQAVLMPAPAFHRLLRESEGFRRFVFGEIGGRMTRLMRLVQEIAFDRTSIRLARLLLDSSEEGGTIETTHADLATELGKTREVVSRLLKSFERHGWVHLSRGGIQVLDAPALARIKDSEM